MKTSVSRMLVLFMACTACDSWHGPSGGSGTGNSSSASQTNMDASVTAPDADIDASTSDMDASDNTFAEADGGISLSP